MLNISITIISSPSNLQKNSVPKHTLKSCHEHMNMPIIKAKKNTFNHPLMNTHSLVLDIFSNQSDIKSS